MIKKRLQAMISVALAASMVMLSAGCAADKEVSGTAAKTEQTESGSAAVERTEYTGTAQGNNGPVIVKVVVEGTEIVGVEVAEHGETPGIADTPIKSIPEAIVSGQTLMVDAVAGATVTSNAILEAVEAALKDANLDIEAFKVKKETGAAEGTTVEKAADVVVVGGGIAGISAGLEAVRAGSKVILLEKMPMLGGSTSRSGGKILAADSYLQREQGIEDTPEAFAAFLMETGRNKINKEKIDYIAQQSSVNIDWLVENGVEFTDKLETPNPKMVPNRGLQTAEGTGAGMINPLADAAKELGVEILMETPAVKLIQDEQGAVTGVEARDKDNNVVLITADAVILATGGFDRNEELKKEYAPTYANSVTNAGLGNTGDGLLMARDAGAQIINADCAIAQIMPFGLAMNQLFTNSGLYVSTKGMRFMDEATPRPARTPIVLEETGEPEFYIILDYKDSSEDMTKAVEEGTVLMADTLEELAEKMGADSKTLVETVERYNKLAAAGNDEDFKKAPDQMIPVEQAPYYAAHATMNTAGTFGGPKTDMQSRVLDANDQAIPGLYAAGEAASGDMFCKEYPGSGTAIQSFLTFGRVAGREAAAYSASK